MEARFQGSSCGDLQEGKRLQHSVECPGATGEPVGEKEMRDDNEDR